MLKEFRCLDNKPILTIFTLKKCRLIPRNIKQDKNSFLNALKEKKQCNFLHIV